MAEDCSCLPVRVPVPPADCWWWLLPPSFPPSPFFPARFLEWPQCNFTRNCCWIVSVGTWKDPFQICFLLSVSAFIHRLLDVRFVRQRTWSERGSHQFQWMNNEWSLFKFSFDMEWYRPAWHSNMRKQSCFGYTQYDLWRQLQNESAINMLLNKV